MKQLNDTHKGIFEAALSSASFGLIPLFTLPVLQAGLSIPSTLVYRFVFACLFMLGILAWQHQSLHLNFGDSLRIAFLSVLYDISAISLFKGYAYMPSGVATTLLFSYPVWTVLIEWSFFRVPLRLFSITAVVMAVVGVYFLSGADSASHSHSISSVIGIIWEMLAGLSYAVYMVVFPRMRISKMPSIKTTFYVFFFALLMLVAYVSFTEGALPAIPSVKTLVCLLLLGLLPTTMSNICVIMALKKISATMVSVLGAFEPLTAMSVGILVFGEPLTINVGVGFLLVIAAVILLILTSGKAETSPKAKVKARKK